MAVVKKTGANTAPKKMTLAQYRNENEKLKEKLIIYEDAAYCSLCGKAKKKDKFYVSTDPLRKSGVTPICKQCAKNIAERVDVNGEYHSVTRDSLIKALRYLDKPFLEIVYNASIQESENLIAGKTKSNVFMSYVKNIAMVNYLGMTFADSDLFKEKVIYDDEKNIDFLKDNIDIGTFDQFERDKNDVIRLLHYDPFIKESIEEQPQLYSQLLGMLDSSEDANDDMLRTSSIITIVRGFSQLSKLDDAITKLMSDLKNIERNAAAIKSLQESKGKLQSIITNLAAESCISMKNSKNAKKGENTWTGKMRKIKDMDFREKDINGFSIGTCKGMQQVANISAEAILRSLKLDESEYTEMIAEQRKKISELILKADSYAEAARIVLKENLDLRDTLKENNLLDENKLIDLDEIVGTYIEGIKDDK